MGLKGLADRRRWTGAISNLSILSLGSRNPQHTSCLRLHFSRVTPGSEQVVLSQRPLLVRRWPLGLSNRTSSLPRLHCLREHLTPRRLQIVFSRSDFSPIHYPPQGPSLAETGTTGSVLNLRLEKLWKDSSVGFLVWLALVVHEEDMTFGATVAIASWGVLLRYQVVQCGTLGDFVVAADGAFLGLRHSACIV